MTLSTPLRRVLTVTLDPAQDIGDLEAGPVFGDEYTSLVLSDDPSDTDRLLYLDGIQEALVTDYLTAWARAAASLAEQSGIELYLVIGEPDSDAPVDELAETFRRRVTELIDVHGEGDAWFVTETRAELHACEG